MVRPPLARRKRSEVPFAAERTNRGVHGQGDLRPGASRPWARHGGRSGDSWNAEGVPATSTEPSGPATAIVEVTEPPPESRMIDSHRDVPGMPGKEFVDGRRRGRQGARFHPPQSESRIGDAERRAQEGPRRA